jgi:membrane protein required for colicin V production
MNALDIIILGIIGVSLLYSTWKGFIRDAFSLVGLVGGFFVASRFYPLAASWLDSRVPYPWMTVVLGWVLIFLIVYIAVSVLGRMVRGSLNFLRLGWVDRLVGFFFGFLKGVLLCAGLLVVLAAFLPPETALLVRSRLAPRVLELTHKLGRWAPGDVGERFQKAPKSSRSSQDMSLARRRLVEMSVLRGPGGDP